MNNILKGISIALILIGCSSPDQNGRENIEIVEKYVKAVESKDFDSMESLLGEEYYGYGPSYNDSISRVDAIAAWRNNAENLYESISYEISRNITETIPDGINQGEWVSNYAQLSINYKDGRGPVKIWANTVYHIENGKIVKSYTFYNEADALRQLGYVFVHPDEY